MCKYGNLGWHAKVVAQTSIIQHSKWSRTENLARTNRIDLMYVLKVREFGLFSPPATSSRFPDSIIFLPKMCLVVMINEEYAHEALPTLWSYSICITSEDV